MKEKPAKKHKKLSMFLGCLLCMTLALVSFFAVSQYTPRYADDCIRELDNQQEKVLLISTAASAAATALAVVPDDSTTPVANEIVDVAKYLVMATSAIILEKFIAAVSWFVLWKISVPVSCFFFFLFLILKKRSFMKAGVKVFIIGICMVSAIPVSLEFNRCIDRVVHTNQMVDEIYASEDSEVIEQKESISFWDKAVSFFTGIVDSAANAADQAIHILNNFITSIAAFIVTACIVPIVTMFLLWSILKWVMKSVIESFLDEKKTGHGAISDESCEKTK